MIAEAFNSLVDALVEAVLEKLGPKLIAWLDARRTQPEEDPLLSADQAGTELGLSGTTIRLLVETGDLKRCPGLRDIKIRRSVVRAYGTNSKPK